jgi:putative transposase
MFDCMTTSGSDGELIRQAYRFALAPMGEQEEFLASCAGASRFWFNQGLSLVKERLDQRAAGEDVGVPWSYQSLCSAFRGAEIKDLLAPWRAEVTTGSYQAGLEALGRALQNFSTGRKAGRQVGFPRYRAKGRCHEAIIWQHPRLADSRHVDLDRRLGPLKTRESMRKLTRLLGHDPKARILRSTVQRSGDGWVISFTVERSRKQRRARQPEAVVGVDLGLTRLVTLSTDQAINNPRPLLQGLIKLRRLQRKLDRQRRANNRGNYHPDCRVKTAPKSWVRSTRMHETEQRIRRLHARVANLRRESAHQLTTALVREYGIVGVETLAVKNLMANRRLARHIADAGWGLILNQLDYKTAWSAGSLLVAADRYFPSSKTCSSCGSAKAKLSLSERVYTCDDPSCGLVIDRDLNAAVNLARMAQEHAQAEGIQTQVARTGRFTHARGGQVTLADLGELSPLKREDPSGSSQHGNALAAAA